LSLAKFVWITAPQTKKGESLSTHNVPAFFKYMMERMDLKRDVHFYTKTTMDTLDYSGEGLNEGSKVVMAAYGDPKRTLCESVPTLISNQLDNAAFVMPGVISINAQNNTIASVQEKLKGLGETLLNQEGVFMLVITEDAQWMAANIQNFLWAGFTRVNPSHDIDGVDAFIEKKHWGCQGPIIFDATIKKHHAPPVLKDEAVEKKVDTILAKYGY
jgi:4-hydroxy-3-polyprenylbenzoate decarboxylase